MHGDANILIFLVESVQPKVNPGEPVELRQEDPDHNPPRLVPADGCVALVTPEGVENPNLSGTNYNQHYNQYRRKMVVQFSLL